MIKERTDVRSLFFLLMNDIFSCVVFCILK